jgi:hypothetical protein
MPMSRQIADMLGDISPEAMFAIRTSKSRARQPMAIVRRLDYLFADTFDTNPCYHRPAAGHAAG